ncbi:MAG TPA: VanZ family protein [Actinopolymorphaceae bacterium]|jgi:glycopeptide antibiotics resistance protein
MSTRELPPLVAPVIVVVVMAALLIPTLGLLTGRSRRIPRRHALLGLGVLVYSIAMLAYVLVPVPRDPGAFCERHHIEPNLVPFAFHDGVGPAVLQLGLNILLFVPLGALLHDRGRHATLTATAAGFALSLLIELTQLTGVWFVYPCAYRHFDVDDIIFNTIGAALGAALAIAVHSRRRRRA